MNPFDIIMGSKGEKGLHKVAELVIAQGDEVINETVDTNCCQKS